MKVRWSSTAMIILYIDDFNYLTFKILILRESNLEMT